MQDAVKIEDKQKGLLTKEKDCSQKQSFKIWCPEEDSNFHVLTDTST